MATSAQPQPVSADASNVVYPSSGEINASCRGPLVFLFTAAAAWLVLGSLLALIGSIQLHGQFLSNVPWLTYGRVRPAQMDIFLYGFASQAAIGIALWLLCRLGRTLLIGPVVITIAAAFWNLAVLFGVGRIILGGTSGYEWLEMPLAALVILLVSYLAIAIGAILTFAARRERDLYISQWFVIAALFIFPWILSTAILLLHVFPVRGMMQAVVDYWFMNQFQQLWLGGIGLAAIFYFIPKVAGQPLYSRALGAVAFWMLLFLAGWCGIPTSARLPAWMPSVSTVATGLLIVPALAFAWSWRATLKGREKEQGGVPFRFILFAAVAYVTGIGLAALGALPAVAVKIEFTHFNPAVTQLASYGFFAMAAFGAIYFIFPQLTGSEWIAGRVKLHFMLSALGTLLIVIPLVIGGFIQGNLWSNPDTAFVDSVRKTVPFVGVSTIGFLALFVGHIVFLSNVLSLMKRWCCPEKRRVK